LKLGQMLWLNNISLMKCGIIILTNSLT